VRNASFAVFVGLLVAGCASPEATRVRGGGPGADIGNRGNPVVFHNGAQPYHDTPCVIKPLKCDGPLPVFSKTWNP
jgi:hypothetical protein